MLDFFRLFRFTELQGNVERESSNFSQVTVFTFTGEQLFPSRLLVVGWNNGRNKSQKRVLTARM